MKPPVWASAAGFLLGIVFVWWLQPLETSGAALVIMVCTAAFTLAGAIFARKRKGDTPPAAAEDGK